MTDGTARRFVPAVASGQALRMTRIGFVIIGVGIVMIAARVVDWVDAESADILSVLAIVIGALVVAVDGERSPRNPS